MGSVDASSQVSLVGDPLVEAITAAVRSHMARYDGSHDFSHIRRVVGTAAYITEQEAAAARSRSSVPVPLDLRLVTLCALLHDVGDRKYLAAAASSAADEDKDDPILAEFSRTDPGARAIAVVMRRCAAPDDLVRLVPVLCQHVSWTTETKMPESTARTAALIAAHPELAVVQDADRLDSIGGIGVARCFAYGGAHGSRTLQGSLDHFDEKLVLVETRMKTATGRRLARERTERLRTFQQWYADESSLAVADPQGAEAEAGGR